MDFFKIKERFCISKKMVLEMRNGPSRGNHLGLPNQQIKGKGAKKSISLTQH